MNDAATPVGTTRRPRAWRIGLLVVAALLAALLLMFDWNWFKGPVERRVSQSIGRPFRILGNLDVDFGSIVIVQAHRLSLANADWSQTREMATADRLRLEVPFWPLLRGERLLRRLDLVRPRLLLERDAAGHANWQFDRPDRRQEAPGRAWQFGELRIHQGELRVRDEPMDTGLELRVDSIPVDDAGKTRLLGHGSGRFKGHEFNLEGRADSPTVLFVSGDEPYDIDFRARAGATRARIWGTLPVPLDPGRFTVHAQLSGDDLEDLYRLLGLALPSTPPYEISGLLERDGRIVRLRDMHGQLGDSDVAGSVTLDARGPKRLLQGELQSKRLDFDDLAGLVGAPPGTSPGETASEPQRAEARERARSSRVLPDKPYDLRKLASMNADVHLQADRVDAGKIPIERIATHFRLQDSVLRLDPLDVGFAGGSVKGHVRLDARREKIDASAKLAVRQIDLRRLWPNMQPPNVGHVNGDIDLKGRGNSVAQMLASADGRAGAAIGRGRFSNLLLELAGLDVAEALKFLIGKDRTVKLRCAYGEFVVQDGKAKAQSLVFDTTDTVIFGSGNINLADESLALGLNPQPKDFSPVTLRGPLEIKGTFKHPSFRPKPRPLVARAAAAVALFTIAPPAALLALIETGPGENVDCGPGRTTGARRKPE